MTASTRVHVVAYVVAMVAVSLTVFDWTCLAGLHVKGVTLDYCKDLPEIFKVDFENTGVVVKGMYIIRLAVIPLSSLCLGGWMADKYLRKKLRESAKKNM